MLKVLRLDYGGGPLGLLHDRAALEGGVLVAAGLPKSAKTLIPRFRVWGLTPKP